jgi:hypothetical protein
MQRARMPFLYITTTDAKLALGARSGRAALLAFVEIAKATKTLEVAHLQFAFEELTLAVCSRVRGDGIVEIEIDLGNPSLPRRVFTAEAARAALARMQARQRATASRRPRHGAW